MSVITQDPNIDVKAAVTQRTEELQHGQYVTGSDGVTGIVIDRQVEMESKQDESIQRVSQLVAEQKKQIAAIEQNGVIPEFADIVTQPDADRRTIEMIENSNDPELMSHLETIQKLEQEAEQWAPTATGIAPANSLTAKKFAEVVTTPDGGFDVTNIDPEALKKQAEEEYALAKEQELRAAEAARQQAIQAEKERTEAIAREIVASGKIDDNEPVTFNVPEGKVRTFISTLPKDTREHVSRTKSIVINEVKKRTVPTNVRQIQSMKEFKNVMRQKVDSGVQSTALPNSGYYATFKGSGSLAMATLLPDRQDQPVDYSKRYSFCYDNLVSTSIGKLSFVEFCGYTSVQDIDLCIYTILRASDPDENMITLVCGDPECKTEYDVKYSLGSLLDMDTIPDEVFDEVEAIVKAKDIYDKAKEVAENAPVRQVKSMDIEQVNGDIITVEVKQSDGSLIIDRTPVIREIAETHNEYVAAMIAYVPRIYLNTIPDGETERVDFEITDPHVIARIIADLDDETLPVLTQILQSLPDLTPPKFSFKGDFECPSCHRHETKIPCVVDSLVFQKVSRAIQ